LKVELIQEVQKCMQHTPYIGLYGIRPKSEICTPA